MNHPSPSSTTHERQRRPAGSLEAAAQSSEGAASEVHHNEAVEAHSREPAKGNSDKVKVNTTISEVEEDVVDEDLGGETTTSHSEIETLL